MQNDVFYSDMALDNLENRGIADLATVKKLSYGISQSVVNVKNNVLSNRIGKPKGVYVTYDTSKITDTGYADYLSKIMASTIRQVVGILPAKSTILAVGLGNGQVLADSLGVKVVERINATRGDNLNDHRYNLCTHPLGVEGATGIKSHEILSALCDKLQPSAILVFDTLSTTNVTRLGASFQMSSAGITPGSGVGSDNPPMNKETYGVPTISIGVPLVLTMQGVIKDFVKSYNETNPTFNLDEFSFHNTLSDKKLSRLVVAPKEVKLHLDNASNIIARAVNLAYSF